MSRRGGINGLFTICAQPGIMRCASVAPVLVLLSLLPGCGPVAPVAGVEIGVEVGVGVGVISAASMPVYHRSAVDILVSAVVGRDCSMVNLGNGEPYCRTMDRAPETPEFCTRSLGVPDCWEDPSKLTNHPREIADGPRALTPNQEIDRTKHWPGLW